MVISDQKAKAILVISKKLTRRKTDIPLDAGDKRNENTKKNHGEHIERSNKK